MGARLGLREVLALVLSLGLAGCTTTVVPPAEVAEPARVGVLDHGRHASLVLETAAGGMVRFAYGDWGWYALEETGAAQGSSALLWPTQGALGRKRLPGPVAPAVVYREVQDPIEHAVYLTVEAEDVRRLVRHLDRLFAENRASRTYNRSYDLVFVHHPERYWMLHNSNQMVARWLEQLGCEISGPALFSRWTLGPGAP